MEQDKLDTIEKDAKIDQEWLKEEQNKIKEYEPGEKLDALKLETNKITVFEIDFSEPFKSWVDGETTKKIIPVFHEGSRKNFWLNVRNPLYSQIIKRGIEGQTLFKVMTTGILKETRYNLVDE